MAETNVVVAVRVRPLNKREKDLNSACIVTMNGGTTELRNPLFGKDMDAKEKSYTFTFDYSFWSYSIPPIPESATQESIFNQMGVGILNNAFEGYNCCLFAYGQTGSGKSYSMVGVPEDKGIVPRVCEEIFKRISEPKEGIVYNVEVSMLEIYNEKVRDLLNPKNNPSNGLQIRENPATGTYAEGLTSQIVNNYAEISKAMDEGTAARTIQKTNMNDKSSRAHTMFQITFAQGTRTKEGKVKGGKTSRITLVDLAGSERIDKTGATGDRAKEGISINLSLTTLGNCIQALADQSNGKKDAFIPFRESALTFLLKNSLGGNSKTIMICAISPADDNFSETLSTLRYANRAKQIKTKAKVNEDPNEKIIRDLREQVSQLQAMMKNQGLDPNDSISNPSEDKEVAKLKDQLEQNQKLIQNLEMSLEEKEKMSKEVEENRKQVLQESGISVGAVDRQKIPHLVNMNEDPMINELLVYPLSTQIPNVLGSGEEPKPTILLSGASVVPRHCTITFSQDEKEASISPEGPTYINGGQITEKTVLIPGDRIAIGTNHIFRYFNPKQAKPSRESYDWSQAVLELAENLAAKRAEEQKQELERQQKELADKLAGLIKEREEQQKALESVKIATQQKEKEEAERISKIQLELEDRTKRLQVELEKDVKDKEMISNLKDEKQKADLKLEMIQQKQNANEENIRIQEQAIKMMEEQEIKLKKELDSLNLKNAEHEKNYASTSNMNETMIRVVTMVNTANILSDNLLKEVEFQVKLVDNEQGQKEAMIHVKDEENNWETLWPETQLAARIEQMNDLYETMGQCKKNQSVFNYYEHAKSPTQDPLWDVDAAKAAGAIWGAPSSTVKNMANIEKEYNKKMEEVLRLQQERDECLNKEIELLKHQLIAVKEKREGNDNDNPGILEAQIKVLTDKQNDAKLVVMSNEAEEDDGRSKGLKYELELLRKSKLEVEKERNQFLRERNILKEETLRLNTLVVKLGNENDKKRAQLRILKGKDPSSQPAVEKDMKKEIAEIKKAVMETHTDVAQTKKEVVNLRSESKSSVCNTM